MHAVSVIKVNVRCFLQSFSTLFFEKGQSLNLELNYYLAGLGSLGISLSLLPQGWDYIGACWCIWTFI